PPQEPPSFEDVTVFLSRAEWDALPPPQRQLYRDVVADTYELLTSLGYPGPKPDILHRLERGEEPWI
ncbi:ZN252 protein, partial [Regulus satrapa]|nr:ZN252 protein [Regulus satrapa]